MQNLFIGLVAGGILVFLIRKYILEPGIRGGSYVDGWVDRHQAVPLAPRFWYHIPFLNFWGTVMDQLEYKARDKTESVHLRLADGLLPYTLNRSQEYAISDREIELLNDPAERAWRGMPTGGTLSRNPGRIDTDDILPILDIGPTQRNYLDLDDVKLYFKLSELEVEFRSFRRVRIIKSVPEV